MSFLLSKKKIFISKLISKLFWFSSSLRKTHSFGKFQIHLHVLSNKYFVLQIIKTLMHTDIFYKGIFKVVHSMFFLWFNLLLHCFTDQLLSTVNKMKTWCNLCLHNNFGRTSFYMYTVPSSLPVVSRLIILFSGSIYFCNCFSLSR